MDIGLPNGARIRCSALASRRIRRVVPSMLLGTFELTPLDVAQLYNGLANGGFKSNLRAVRAVLGADGKALKAFNAGCDAGGPAGRRLCSSDDDGAGDGARYRRAPRSPSCPPSLVVAGKSGTSSDLRDSWFAGFSGMRLRWCGLATMMTA